MLAKFFFISLPARVPKGKECARGCAHVWGGERGDIFLTIWRTREKGEGNSYFGGNICRRLLAAKLQARILLYVQCTYIYIYPKDVLFLHFFVYKKI